VFHRHDHLARGRAAAIRAFPGAVATYLTLAPAAEGGSLAELARLEAMGATVIVEPEDDSTDLWILEDPEGNAFSLWRSGARPGGLLVALDPAAPA
jgi:hypothetical protein